MIEVFGKEYRLSFFVFLVIGLSSLVIIFWNVFYFIKYGETVFTMNVRIGLILFAYSVYNLFLKEK